MSSVLSCYYSVQKVYTPWTGHLWRHPKVTILLKDTLEDKAIPLHLVVKWNVCKIKVTLNWIWTCRPLIVIWSWSWLSLVLFDSLKQTWNLQRPARLCPAPTDSLLSIRNHEPACISTQFLTHADMKWKTTVTHTLLIPTIRAIDFSVSLLMNWLKMSYYALCQLPVKQDYSNQSSYGQKLCFDQLRQNWDSSILSDC